MARELNGSDQALYIDGTAPVTSMPLSLYVVFSDDGGTGQQIVGQRNSDGTDDTTFRIQVRNDGQIAAQHLDDSGNVAQAVAGDPASGWNRALAVFVNASDRSIYLNSASATQDAGLLGGSFNPDNLSIGATLFDGVANLAQFFDGRVAEVAVWSAELSDGDAESLINGLVSPQLVRPDAMAAYYRLLDNDGDIDWWGSNDLTSVNAPTYAAHPPVIYPGGIAQSERGDTTTPTLTNPTVTDTTDGQVTYTVDTDEGNGTIYVVATQSSTKPTKGEVKAGNDHTGSSADGTDTVAVSSTGTQNGSISGLSANPDRWLHMMHEDAAGNQSAVVTSNSFSFSIVINVPTPSTRMDPAVVVAAIDRDNSDITDGSRFEQCRIDWKLEGPLNSLPAKYRYVPDPRPGRTQGQLIDLAGDNWVPGTASSWSPATGLSMGWVLTEGEWTIKARLTNKSGNQIIGSTSVTVSSNTRTKKYVDSTDPNASDSAGGGTSSAPYATLEFAASDTNGTSDIELVIRGGHTETISNNIWHTFNNHYWRWTGNGSRPVISAPDRAIRIDDGPFVLESIQIDPTSSSAGDCMRSDGDFHAFIDVVTTGSISGNRFDSSWTGYFSGTNRANAILHRCTFGETQDIGISYQAKFDRPILNGNAVGQSKSEVCYRTTGDGDHRDHSLRYNTFDAGSSSKDSVRFTFGSGHTFHGNYVKNRLLTLNGDPSGEGSDNSVATVRIESNYFEGAGFGASAGASDAFVCNNVFTLDSDDKALTHNDGITNVEFCNNTIEQPADDWLIDLRTLEDSDTQTGLNLRANLAIITAGSMPTTDAVFAADDDGLDLSENNVWPDPDDHPVTFLRTGTGGTPTHSLSQWNSESFVSPGDQTVTTTLDASHVPSPKTSVSLPDGVFTDFYNTNRTGSSSTAGAVANVKVAPEPLTVTVQPVAPKVPNKVKPSPLRVTVRTVAPRGQVLVKPAPLTVTVRTVAPRATITAKPAPLQVPVKLLAPARTLNTVQPAPLVVPVRLQTPTIKQTVQPSPLTMTVKLPPYTVIIGVPPGALDFQMDVSPALDFDMDVGPALDFDMDVGD